MLAAAAAPQLGSKVVQTWGAGEGAAVAENGGAGPPAAERLQRLMQEVEELQVDGLGPRNHTTSKTLLPDLLCSQICCAVVEPLFMLPTAGQTVR